MNSEEIFNLNEEQKKALVETDGAVLVTAGAGSGKTRLLTHRIAHLICNLNVKPYEILALTFTNKAANEMKERVEKMIEGGEKVWISTFHSMCAKLLRMEIENLGDYDKNFTIYSDQDVEKVFKNIFAKFNIERDEDKKSIIFHINNMKNNNMDIFAYKKQYELLDNITEIEKVYIEYQKELKNLNALDFNDLLNVTYKLFVSCPEVLNKYASRFRYILVDEFQDTNKIQYDLLKMLSSVHKNIFVVGDEDQCIYSWRGANFTNIFDFRKDFENVKVFKLERNYRSTKKILNLANTLIKNNKTRLEKNLWTENDAGAEVSSRNLYDEKEEAEIVAREIYDLVNNHGYKYSDFAVLMRLNALTMPFEERFLAYNIPHKIFGGFKFYERTEVKNVISYLRLFVNPRDDVSFERVINFPKRGIGESAISALRQEAKSYGLNLLGTLISNDVVLPQALEKKFASFKESYIKLLSDYEFLSLSDFVVRVIKDFNIKSAYSSGSEEDINRLLNIDMLVSQVAEFEEKNPDALLLDFLESVTLISDIDSLDDANNAVSVATVHAVKGLEFRYVFVVGLEEKIFPISRAFDKEDELEEERRLMYVAITRAKENLMLTSCKTRFLYGRREFERPSRFLREINLAPAYENITPQFSNYGGGYNNSYSSPYKKFKISFDDEDNSSGMSKTISTSKYGYNPMKQSESTQPTKYEEFRAQNTSKTDISKFAVGQKVLHTKFGIGQITKIDGKFADINFDKLGVKTIMLEISPMKVIK